MTAFAYSSLIHIEIPERIYSQNKDPNPICFMHIGRSGMYTRSTTGEIDNYSGGWVMHNPLDNSVVRKHRALIRGFQGFANYSSLYNSDDGAHISEERFKQIMFNQKTKKHIIHNVFLGRGATSDSYCMSRAKLRLVAIAAGPPQLSTLFGQNGEWISADQGVLFPWDNAQLNRTLFPGGA